MMQATADPDVNKSVPSSNCSASSANAEDSLADVPLDGIGATNVKEHGHERGCHFRKKKKNRRPKPKVCQRPLLRPAGSQVPRAPENSTQFIMDNHENSNLFYNFDSNKEISEEEVEISIPTTFNSFAVNDFERAYRSAHEESLMTSNIDELKSAIVNLENRRANLQHTIQSRPSVLLDNLQNMLIALQEENKHLQQEKKELMHPDKKPPKPLQDSDTDSSSTSSSSYSDSDSSNSECNEAGSKHNQ